MRNISIMFFPALLIFSGCTTLSAERGSLNDSMTAYDSAPALAKSKSFSGVNRMRRMDVSADGVSAGGYFQQSSRQMAYTAGFSVVVKEQKKALEELKTLCEKLGDKIEIVMSKQGKNPLQRL